MSAGLGSHVSFDWQQFGRISNLYRHRVNILIFIIDDIPFLESVFLLDYWSASEMIVYCDREMFESLGKTHHFALMNHGYEIDWLVGWSFLEKHSMLGFGRSFVKNVIRYIPIAGWMFGLSEQIFLQRSFDKDKQVMESGLENILSYPYSSCVIVTAEGTRMTEEKHKASVKFAQERNIQPLKHHLLPRPKGFMTCVPILKQNKPKLSVFNYQLAYDNESKVKPTLLNIIRGEKVTSHIYIENIPVDELEATPEYLHKVYQRKDELQDSFVKYGNFYEGRNLKPVTGHKYKPRIATLINSLFWFSLNFFFITYYATSLILAGRLVFLLSVSSAIIALCEYHAQRCKR